MEYVLTKSLVEEAQHYAEESRSYTSNRHDFHEGGLSAKQRKMFEGKLGEKGIKMFFNEHNIFYEEDHSSPEEEDNYDFTVRDQSEEIKTVDVKTRTKSFHTRTLEMVEQFNDKPKDIYISVRLFTHPNQYTIKIIGWAGKHDFFRINRIENLGYLDNYVLLDDELRDIDDLLPLLDDIS